jgi:mannosyltransferase PIG-V
LSLWLIVNGSYRAMFDGSPFTIRWWDLLIAALVIAGLRHAISPTPTIVTRIVEWKAQLTARPALVDALLAGGLTRVVVLLVGLIAVSAIGFPPDSGQLGSGRQAVPGLGARFDGNWYAGIAASGYDWEGSFDRQQNMAFFPAYPMLMRAAGALTGALNRTVSPEQRLFRLTGCGIVISIAAFLWAAWYFARLSSELLEDEHARGALWLLAAYPFAVFFSAAYTESLFLLSAVGAWYSLRHRQFVAGSLWGLLAGLARPNGFFLSVPLGLIALGLRDGPGGSRTNKDAGQARGSWQFPDVRQVVTASMPVLGMLAFTVYLYSRTGEWFAWAKMHAAWGRTFSAEVPLAGVTRATNSLLDLIVMRPYDALNLFGLTFAIVMLWPVWRRLGLAWVAFILINMVPPLFAGGLLSIGRLSATMFPVFLALAATLPPRSIPAVAAAFAMMQGLVAALFFTWRSLY